MRIPYLKEIQQHEKQAGHTEGSTYKGYGNKKRDKIAGLYCKKCEKFITPIRIMTKKAVIR